MITRSFIKIRIRSHHRTWQSIDTRAKRTVVNNRGGFDISVNSLPHRVMNLEPRDPVVINPIMGNKEKTRKGIYRCAAINVGPESMWL